MMRRNKDEIRNILKPYLEKRKEVLMAFLFGSVAQEKYCQESDIDLAVYLKEETRVDKLWNVLEGLLHREVDLVVLNRAPATLSWSVLRKGVPIVIKNRSLFLDFLINVSTEAEDFIEFNFDTWRMKNAHREK